MMTKKDIFAAKLRGEPINVSADNFYACRPLLEKYGIVKNRGGAGYKIICEYPTNIWKATMDGPAFDALQPGDTYWWA